MLKSTSKPLKMYVKIININLLTEIITHSWGIYTKNQPGMETLRSQNTLEAQTLELLMNAGSNIY